MLRDQARWPVFVLFFKMWGMKYLRSKHLEKGRDIRGAHDKRV